MSTCASFGFVAAACLAGSAALADFAKVNDRS